MKVGYVLKMRCLTFCTLMLWLVLLKITLARMALANRRACKQKLVRTWMLVDDSSRRLWAYLCRYFFLLLPWEIDKVIVLCADEEGNGRFVKATPLAVPFLYRVEGALTGEIEHEEYGDGVVTD